MTKGVFVEVSRTATLVGMSGSNVTCSHSSSNTPHAFQALGLVPHPGNPTSGAPVALKLVHGPRGNNKCWGLYELDAEELLA